MLSAPLVIAVSFAYLLLLFAVAYWGDWRAAQGRSVISSPWVYALSMAVYCTAWTYFGSVGRAANSGVWFLPIYLGPMLAMILAWMVVRKMIRVAKTYRITSIADFIASRYGKSPLLAGLVTMITVVGIVPYIALQLKAIASGYAVLTSPLGSPAVQSAQWWNDSTLYVALMLAGFTMVFGARHLDSTERMKAWWQRSLSSRWSSWWPSWRWASLSRSACSPARPRCLTRPTRWPNCAACCSSARTSLLRIRSGSASPCWPCCR
ncbi:putative symporter YodF [Hydrogenophaga sp. T4]|nr:putative symporter YodF [Hydrogenophaga sp. T4]